MKERLKVIILIICLGIIISALYSNPCVIFEGILSEVWFADNGHLMMEFYSLSMPEINLNTLTIVHGDYQENFPDSVVVNHESAPSVVDITALMPGMVFNPEEDSLTVKIPLHGNYYWFDSLKWGNSSGANITPPMPGQSLVHNIAWIENTWSAWTMPGDVLFEDTWVKDSPPTPGTQCFEAVARSNIKVIVTDQNNDPVPFVPILHKYSGKYNLYTDSQGIYTDVSTAGKYHLSLKHPVTGEIIHDQYYWLEPNQTKEIPISVNIEPGTPIPPIPDNLRAFPSPFNIQKTYNRTMYFQYSGAAKLANNSYIKVYDIKGRYVSKIPMTGNGISRWNIREELKSGMYFARLISGSRVIKTTTFTVINSKIKNDDY